MSPKRCKGAGNDAALKDLLAENGPVLEAKPPFQDPQNGAISQRDMVEIMSNIAYIERHIMAAKTYSARLHDSPRHGQSMVVMLEELEKARIAARKIIDLVPASDEQKAQALNAGISDISISVPDVPALLLITLFPLLHMQIKGGYNVYFEVKFALENYLQEHPLSLPDGRYVLVYRRIVRGNVALSAGHCDNDNFEMKRVTNAITEAIHVADSVDKFSFYYTTAAGNEAKTEVYLVSESQFPDLIKTFISRP